MKKYLLCCLCFCAISIGAQVVFSPPGAVWSYNFKMTGAGAPGTPTILEKIVYARDSVIGNDTVKVLTHHWFHLECSWIPVNLTLIKQSGDTVFMRNYATDSTWQILYNFNTLPGQSWHTTINVDVTTLNPTSDFATYTITVDSVKSINENGFALKRLFVTYQRYYPSGPFAGTLKKHYASITERFGCNGFMFNYYNNTIGYCDDDYFTRNLCYTDSEFSAKQFTSFPCDFSNPTWLNSIEAIEKVLSIFPNPAKNILNVKLDGALPASTHIKIVNSLGEIMIKTDVTASTTEIDTSSLSSGIYFVMVGSDENVLANGKFVKQ